MEDLLQMFPVKFCAIWSSGFRGEHFQKLTNQKQELSMAAMFVNRTEQNIKMNKILIQDLPWMLPTKFRFIWPHSFRGENFQKSTNQKQELQMAAMFVNMSGRNQQSLQRTFHRCFLPSFVSFGHVVSEKKIQM